MARQTLTDLYRQFMKKEHVGDMESQRQADIRFLQMALPGMRYSPVKLGQVLQKHSLNRVIHHYGKKLVQEVSRQPEYLESKEKLLNKCYPDNVDNHFKL